MKFDTNQVAIVENQTSVPPDPKNDTSVAHLLERFGDDPFFINPNGLCNFEEVEQPKAEEGAVPALLLQITEWIGSKKPVISPVKPQPV